MTYIAPTVEEKTRTVKVRIEVDNQGGALKPDMFADVLLRVDLGTGLVVPDSAVIDAGDRKLVFLDRPDGRSSRARWSSAPSSPTASRCCAASRKATAS